MKCGKALSSTFAEGSGLINPERLDPQRVPACWNLALLLGQYDSTVPLASGVAFKIAGL